MLSFQNLSVEYGRKTVLHQVSFDLKEGQWLMLLGPNGAGKSTLIKALSSAVPCKGEVLFKGRDVKQMKPRERACCMGVLSQTPSANFAFTVEEAVRLGRYARRSGFFSLPDEENEELINEALRLTDLMELKHRKLTTLSGGELQRVFLSQVFAQNPSVLLLDEPTAALDIRHQMLVLQKVHEWLTAIPGRAVVSAIHDLSLARNYGTQALLMSGGACLDSGEIDRVMRAENLDKAYQMDVISYVRRMAAAWETDET